MVRRWRNFVDDDKGSVLVEMAICAPIMATMVVGMVDLSNAFGRKLAIEQAAQRAIEKVMNTTGEDTVEQTIINEASSQAGVSPSNVTVNYRTECDGTVSSSSCTEDQQESKWIEVTVTDKYTPLFKMKFTGISADGTYHVSATAGVRVK